MNINRHNYENFFLLYVDNELAATDRIIVEKFVKENPDLQQELQSLLNTSLVDEPIEFQHTQHLYKSGIELDNLQQNLLLYIDDELPAFEKKELQLDINTNRNIQKELQLWQQTKLDAEESVLFKNKKILYRHEHSRVFSMNFRRIAAAAILLFGLFAGIMILNRDQQFAYPVAINHGATKTPVIKKAGLQGENVHPSNDAVASTDKKDNTNNAVIENSPPSQKEPASTVSTIRKTVTTKTDLLTTQSKDKKKSNNDLFALQENKNQAKKTDLENINKLKSNKLILPVVTPKKNEDMAQNSNVPGEVINRQGKEKIAAPVKPMIDYNSIPSTADSYATTAVLTDATPQNNNKILYLNEETVTRSKVGGLFRQVKRIIERNTNINTGNGVKIAGFEIALK